VVIACLSPTQASSVITILQERFCCQLVKLIRRFKHDISRDEDDGQLRDIWVHFFRSFDLVMDDIFAL